MTPQSVTLVGGGGSLEMTSCDQVDVLVPTASQTRITANIGVTASGAHATLFPKSPIKDLGVRLVPVAS